MPANAMSAEELEERRLHMAEMLAWLRCWCQQHLRMAEVLVPAACWAACR